MNSNRINVRVTYGATSDSGTHGKRTTPGWSDPTDWINRLDTESRVRAEIYLAVTAQRNRQPGSYTDDGMQIEAACTVHASAVLSSIATALNEIPVFKKHPASTVLNDLVLALNDLALGDLPVLLRRGARWDDSMPVGQETVVGYVTLCLRLLRDGHGFSDAKARSEVAKILAKHGWLGRKGKALSASTLQDWQVKYSELPSGHVVREDMERIWGEWTSNPDGQNGRDLSKVLNWVEMIAASPDLQNKVTRKRG